MAPNATPPKPTLRSKLHLRPSTSLKVSKASVFTLLALISIQTVSSALLWYAGKIKADSSSRVVTTSPASSVTTTGATLSGTYDYPTDVTQRGFQYGLTTGYGSQVVDDSVMTYVDTGILGGVDTSSGSSGYATDSTGNLYLTHFDDHTSASVQKYSASGTLVSEFGSQGAGDGQFDTPQDVALDTSGNIYVADTNNNRVQKLDSTGNYVSQFDPLEQGSGKYIVVTRVSLDSLGNIYVFGHWDSDPGISNNWQPVVQRYNASGVFQTQLINSSGTATNQLYSYAQNTDLTTDTSNNLYITDAYNHRVLKYDSSGNFLAQWGTTGVASNAPGQFNLPTGIARGPGGQLYISDGGNDRVQIISPAGDYVQSWSDNQIGFPLNLTVSLNGKIYAQSWGGAGGLVVGTPSINANITSLQCDTTYHYRAFTTDADSTEYGSDATFTTDACTGLRNITNLPTTSISQTGATLHGATDYPQGITGRGFQYGLTTGYGSTVVDSSAVNASFGSKGVTSLSGTTAIDLSVDANGYKYVAYYGDHVVKKYDASNNLVLQWGSEGLGAGQFGGISGITAAPDGFVYTTEYYLQNGGDILSNPRVQKFDSNGNFITQWGSLGSGDGQFSAPKDVAVDKSNNVYVVDYNRVQKFDSNGNFITQWGSLGSGDGQFSNLSGIAIAPDGSVYVSDRSNARIQKFSSSGTFILKWGQPGGMGDGEFIAPERVGVDGSGNVYVLDYAGGTLRMQKFDSNGSFLARFGGYFYFGTGLSVTPSGQVYTIDAASTTDYYTYGIDAPITTLTCGTEYHYRPYVTDRGGTQYGNDATFTTSACPPLNITTTSLDDGVVGVSYSDLITVDNLQGGETYTVSSGSVPPGLTLGSTTGYLEGIPSQEGHYFFDVTVENSGSSDTAQIDVHIYNTNPQLSITTVAIPDTQVGASYQEYIYTSDGVGDVSFSITSGALPDGMSITSYGTSGVLYGTPTTPGTYTFTVQAQDSRGAGVGTDTQEYSITVSAASINITTTSLPSGLVGLPYNKSIDYESANAQPVFSLVSGTLPPGVSLTLQGYLQGTPTQQGTYDFTVQADDGFSTDTQALSLLIGAPAAVTPNTPFVKITSPANGGSIGATKLDVAGIGPAGNKVIQLTIDNVVQGTTNTDNEGKWAYQASGLNPGSHTLSATWVPGDDVAFVPFFNPETFSSGISVIDNASLQTVKTIYLPEYSLAYGVTLNHARTKLYAYGGQLNLGEGELTSSAQLWEVDLATMAIRTVGYPSMPAQIGFVTAVNISPDDTGVVLLKMEGGEQAQQVLISRVDLPSFTPTGTDIQAEALNTPAVVDRFFELALARAYTYSTDSQQRYMYFLLSALDDAPSSNEVVVIDTLDGSSSTIELGEGAEYIPKVIQTVGDRLYVLTSSHLLTIDVVTGGILSDITPGFSIDGSAFGSVVFDVPPDGLTALLSTSGFGNSTTVVSIDLASGQSTILPNSIETSRRLARALGKQGPIGIGTTSDGSRLYISSQGLYIFDMANGVPIDLAGLLPPGAEASGLTSHDYIAPIRPRDTIAFTVASGPVSCTTTNTCPPPPPCAVTNTCPPPPPPPTEPATVGTTNPKTPKIVVTPFPPAASAASRLGWFDRGVLAVARFVPGQAAIGFPFLLFLLLLLFALSLYYQSANEVRKDKLNRQFLAKRKSIRAQQDNFIALASHYLNTPITIIQNGIEVMEESSRGPKSK